MVKPDTLKVEDDTLTFGTIVCLIHGAGAELADLFDAIGHIDCP